MRNLSKKNFTLILRWVGVKIIWPGQLTNIQNNATKKTADFDLNYVYN